MRKIISFIIMIVMLSCLTQIIYADDQVVFKNGNAQIIKVDSDGEPIEIKEVTKEEVKKEKNFILDLLMYGGILLAPVFLFFIVMFIIFKYHSNRIKCIFLYNNLNVEIKNIKPDVDGNITYNDKDYCTTNERKRFFNGWIFKKPIFCYVIGNSLPLELDNFKQENKKLAEYYHTLQENKLWLKIMGVFNKGDNVNVILIIGGIIIVGLLVLILGSQTGYISIGG